MSEPRGIMSKSTVTLRVGVIVSEFRVADMIFEIENVDPNKNKPVKIVNHTSYST